MSRYSLDNPWKLDKDERVIAFIGASPWVFPIGNSKVVLDPTSSSTIFSSEKSKKPIKNVFLALMVHE